MEELSIKEIKLVPLSEADLETVRQWRNSPEVAQYMYTDDFISTEQQQAWFQRVKTDTTQKYWIINYQDQQLGLASLYNIKPAFGTCYWAFYLGDASVRGAGIGAKVEFRMLEQVFETEKLNKLLCEVFTFNDKVIAMHEKFGFRREGYFRQQIIKGGKKQDIVSLALLKEEWDALKESLFKKVYRK